MENLALRKQWAIKLARMGFYIFPIPAFEKKPEIGAGSWLTRMSNDPAMVESWFADSPDINYGVCPGDRYFIIDLDQKGSKKGLDHWRVLEEAEDIGDWVSDCTLTIRTPSGGVHQYLGTDTPVGNAHRFGDKDDGVDLRGSHGYVVGPYSYTMENPEDGTYEGLYEIAVDTEIMAAPEWVMSRTNKIRERADNAADAIGELDTPGAIARAALFLEKTKPAVSGQNGNDWTYATFARLRSLAISEEKAIEMVMEPDGWNSRCEPPWTKPDLELIAHNAYVYAKQAAGSMGGGVLEHFDAVMGINMAGDPNSPDYMQDISTIDFSDDAPPPAQPGVDPFAKLREIDFPGATLTSRNKTREMLVPEWAVAHGVGLFLAQRGMGKTTIMLDLALRVACDLPWHNIQTAKDWVVVYLCGEDDEGAEAMMGAWIKKYGIEPSPERFRLLAGIVNLIDPENVALWTGYLRSVIPHDKRVLIVGDTWQRATASGSQNDDQEMNSAVTGIEYMADKLNGMALMAVHPPKNNAGTTMGSSVIENTSSFIWQLAEKDGFKNLSVTRIKGKGLGNYAMFKFSEIMLGRKDTFGNEISAVIPVKVGGTGIQMSEEMKETVRSVRNGYACLIRDLIIDAEKDEEYQRARDKYFSLSDTAKRIIELPQDHPSVVMLSKQGENMRTDRVVRDRLKTLFVDQAGNEYVGDEYGEVGAVPHKNSFRFRIFNFDPMIQEIEKEERVDPLTGEVF